jgi:uncharacterized protein (DUF342 family)
MTAHHKPEITPPGIDGSCRVYANEDETQAFVDVKPPQGSGKAVTVAQVKAMLKKIGVGYGISDASIADAIRSASQMNMPATHRLVAEGEPPRHGVDAKLVFKVDEELLMKGLRRNADDTLDYLSLDPKLRVGVGQTLAVLLPGEAPKAGKTFTLPPRTVPARRPLRPSVRPGPNVELRTEDNEQRFVAKTDGYAEVRDSVLRVYQITLHAGTLIEPMQVDGDLVVRGDVARSNGLTVRGNLIVTGSIRDSRVDVRGRVSANDIVSSTVLCDGELRARSIIDSEVATSQRVLACAASSTIVGGQVSGFEGVVCTSAGDEQATKTHIGVGIDYVAEQRLFECDQEIARVSEAASRLAQELEAAIAATPARERLQKNVRETEDAMTRETAELQTKLQALRAKKAALTQRLNEEETRGALSVTGKAHAGVCITTKHASLTLEEPALSVMAIEDPTSPTISLTPLRPRSAAA